MEEMKCKNVQDLLSGYFDNTLSEQYEYEVEVHLSYCDKCRGILHDLMKISDLISETECPPALDTQTVQEPQETQKPELEPKQKIKLPPLSKKHKLFIAGLFIILVGVSLWQVPEPTIEPEPVIVVPEPVVVASEPVVVVPEPIEELEVEEEIVVLPEYKPLDLSFLEEVVEQVIDPIPKESTVDYRVGIEEIFIEDNQSYSSLLDSVEQNTALDLTSEEQEVMAMAEARARYEQQQEISPEPVVEVEDVFVNDASRKILYLKTTEPTRVLGVVRDKLSDNDLSVMTVNNSELPFLLSVYAQGDQMIEFVQEVADTYPGSVYTSFEVDDVNEKETILFYIEILRGT